MEIPIPNKILMIGLKFSFVEMQDMVLEKLILLAVLELSMEVVEENKEGEDTILQNKKKRFFLIEWKMNTEVQETDRVEIMIFHLKGRESENVQ